MERPQRQGKASAKKLLADEYEQDASKVDASEEDAIEEAPRAKRKHGAVSARPPSSEGPFKVDDNRVPETFQHDRSWRPGSSFMKDMLAFVTEK